MTLPVVSRHPTLWRWLWQLAVVGGLAVYLFTPATRPLDPTLDVSNYVSYAYFTAQGAQFGDEVLPMVGPLGFILYGDYYGGYLFWTRIVLEAIKLVGFGVLVVWFTQQLPHRAGRILWLAGVVLLTANIDDAAFDLSILLCGLFLVLARKERPTELLGAALATGFLAFLALLKGTQFFFAVLTVVVLALESAWRRDRRVLLGIPALFFVCLLLLWRLCGQELNHLPRFFFALLELSRGYNETMGLQEELFPFLAGALSLGLLGLGTVIGLGLALKDTRTAAALILLGAFGFVSWKHGFVRADGHMLIFFRYISIAAIILLGLRSRIPFGTDAWGRWSRHLTFACPIGVIGISAIGTGANTVAIWRWELSTMLSKPFEHVRYLADIGAQKHALDESLTAARQEFSLPRISEHVGTDSIDFYGSHHGFLLLNRLNYRPRPMGGGAFNVFTPWLQEANAAHLADAVTAPRHYLADIGSIDERFIPQDDSLTLLALLEKYRPAVAERGMVLLQRDAQSPAATLRPLGRQPLTLDAELPLPVVPADEMLLASFELPLTATGRLRSFLYKPPLLYVHFEGKSLHRDEFLRLLPSMAQHPVLLSPYLENNTDLLALYAAQPPKATRSIRLTSPQPHLWASDAFQIQFYAAKRPTADPDLLNRLQKRLQYPNASEPPVELKPSTAPLRTFNGQLVRMVDPPGYFAFRLDGNETSVDFSFGLDDASWQGDARTDGVTFQVEFAPPGGANQVLFRRDLNPRNVPTDRGRHRVRAPLPAIIPPGSMLYLTTGYGPNNDGAWDWSYLADIRINDGPFEAIQFPGFSLLPVAATGSHCAPLDLGDRKVVLLNAPGALEFVIPPAGGTLHFTGGLVEGAYREGESDGVDYVVEQITADESVQELYRRALRPRSEPADQGLVAMSVTLPTVSDPRRVRLRIDPGPQGNIGWDWSFLTEVHLQ